MVSRQVSKHECLPRQCCRGRHRCLNDCPGRHRGLNYRGRLASPRTRGAAVSSSQAIALAGRLVRQPQGRSGSTVRGRHRPLRVLRPRRGAPDAGAQRPRGPARQRKALPLSCAGTRPHRRCIDRRGNRREARRGDERQTSAQTTPIRRIPQDNAIPPVVRRGASSGPTSRPFGGALSRPQMKYPKYPSHGEHTQSERLCNLRGGGRLGLTLAVMCVSDATPRDISDIRLSP